MIFVVSGLVSKQSFKNNLLKGEKVTEKCQVFF